MKSRTMGRANGTVLRVRNKGRLWPMTPTPPGHLTQGLAANVLIATVVAGLLLAACQPTVKVEAPKEPITINLNIKLDADIRLKIEEQAQEDIAANPDIF